MRVRKVRHWIVVQVADEDGVVRSVHVLPGDENGEHYGHIASLDCDCDPAISPDSVPPPIAVHRADV